MENKDFIFSLYPDDLIEVEHKKELVFSIANKESTLPPKWETSKILAYYVSFDISTGAIKISSNDNAYILRGLGIKTLLSLRKYEVDILGNLREVSKEQRQSFR